MPAKTFYNLPEEKRERLLSAIREELARVPFEQVSINQIVRSAGISRGSFYQYFADKTDMLNYVLEGYREQGRAYVLEGLRETGDLFRLFEDILDFAIAFARDEQNYRFCQNLFTDLRINSLLCLKCPQDTAEQRMLEDLRAHIRTDGLDLREPEDLACMTGVLFSVCREAMAEVFTDVEHWEQARDRYRHKLLLLKRGFLKEKP